MYQEITGKQLLKENRQWRNLVEGECITVCPSHLDFNVLNTTKGWVPALSKKQGCLVFFLSIKTNAHVIFTLAIYAVTLEDYLCKKILVQCSDIVSWQWFPLSPPSSYQKVQTIRSFLRPHFKETDTSEKTMKKYSKLILIKSNVTFTTSHCKADMILGRGIQEASSLK